VTSPSRLLRIASTDFLAFVFPSMYASMAAKSYILNYMWTAANFIIKGRRLCTVALQQLFPNLFEPLPKSWCRLRLITLNKNFSRFRSKISFAVIAHNTKQQCGLVPRFPLKSRVLPPGGNLPPVWEPLLYKFDCLPIFSNRH